MSEIVDFVDTLQEVHAVNSRAEHFARDRNSDQQNSTMHLTPFVYEFFLYNSLYQIDWPKSLETGQIKLHPSDKERPRQKAFEDFLRERSKPYPHLICKAFKTLSEEDIKGSWTTIVSDPFITEECGEKFFKNLDSLQNRLKRLSDQPTLHDEVFNFSRECRLFVNLVRNNIFHGRKSLADMDYKQNRRIKIYYLFLNSLLCLFFRLMSEDELKRRFAKVEGRDSLS